MKTVNLRNVAIAKQALSEEQLNRLFKAWGVQPKPQDLDAILCLVRNLESLVTLDSKQIASILDNCFLGFTIPRISKEFDCLWIGERTIVNIELKSHTVADEKMKKQLVQNQYYLSHTGKEIKSFSYDASTDNCYSLSQDNSLSSTDVKAMGKALYDIHKEELLSEGIEKMFMPEHYLVSPFNSSLEFLRGRYFLTQQQRTIKDSILKIIEDDISCFAAITGGPGSGKTLLTYDIAKTLMGQGKRVVIGHAGALNQGHVTLRENGWQIYSTKDLFIYDYQLKIYVLNVDADVYIIDEAQRSPDIDKLEREVKSNNKKCIFSFDGDQVMNKAEQDRDNPQKIRQMAGQFCYTLTSNIRTNAAVSEFIMSLFDIRHTVNRSVSGNVEITYCKDEAEATAMLEVLRDKGYEVPQFTPMVHSTEEYEDWFPSDSVTAHKVIGQEFDCVAGLLSRNLYYNGDGVLCSHKNYRYGEDRMLYQILTRARRKIHIVVVNNPMILERCLKLVEVGENR